MKSQYHRSSRISRDSRIKTQSINLTNITKPFQSSLSAIIINQCDKCTQEIQKGNVKMAKNILLSMDKDLILLQNTHNDYARLMSLVYNTKAGYYRKIEQNQEALKFVDEAIKVQKQGNVDLIDMARTLLNKSAIMGQMAKDNPDKYSHQAAIALAKEALIIIKNRPQGKLFVHKDQYKLGEIIIISFHNIATQFMCLKNEKQGYNLYKKAYDLALRVLGPRHNLTFHLKSIISKYKEEQTIKKRVMTQEPSPQRQKKISYSYVKHSNRKTNFMQKNKKFKSFFQIYGYEKSSLKERKKKQLDMSDLQKIKEMYKSSNHKTSGNSYFPQIKLRKNAKDILIRDTNQLGKEIAAKRPYANSVNDRQKLIKDNDLNKNVINISHPLQKLKTQSVVLPRTNEKSKQKYQTAQNNSSVKNQIITKNEEAEQQRKQQQQKLQEGGCQLI